MRVERAGVLKGAECGAATQHDTPFNSSSGGVLNRQQEERRGECCTATPMPTAALTDSHFSCLPTPSLGSCCPSLHCLSARVCCAAAMSSFYNPLQRFYKFVLKRLLGSFLSSELDLEQLDVALSSGDVTLHRLNLNTQQLNEWADGLPVRVQSARIASLHCRVPWRSLLSQHCTLHIRGLHINLTPIAASQSQEVRGQSLQDSVYGAINDGLQRLSSRQLRQQVRLHRQLASAIHSQQAANTDVRHMDAAEEERRLAEAEAERDRAERTRRRRRRRLQRLANRRAAQGRVRTQEGGNVEPDTDTDADTNDERTDEEDDEAEDSQQQRYEPQAGRKEAKEEEADEDIAAAGLRVVASFIERVVSMTEVSMDDITISLECPIADSSPQQAATRPQPTVRLEMHIPSLEYCDMSRAASPPSDINTVPASLPPLSAGPVFSYSKLIRLHGFHLTLRTPDGEQLTVAHADVGQQCDVRVKVRMLDGRTVAETEVDVGSLRALLAPRQLTALSSLAEVLGSSSRLAARIVLAERDAERLKVRRKERSSANHGRKTHDSMSESDWSESGGTHSRQTQQHPTSSQHPQHSSTPSTPSSKLPSSLPPSAPSSTTTVSSPLWSVSLHVHQALVAVLEDDDSIRAEWWLEPVTLPHSSTTPTMILSPLISGLSVDHLLLSLHHARLDASLTGKLLSSSLTVSELLVEEYLQEYRLLHSTLPSLSDNGSLVYNRKQQRVGFSVRRLMWFERHSISAQPHVRCVIESAVDGLLPPTELEPHTSAAVSSCVTVDLLPVHIDLDLGLLGRLSALYTALSAGPLSDQRHSSVQSSLSSSLPVAPLDGSTTLYLERTLSDVSSSSSPSSSALFPSQSAAPAASSSAVRVTVSSVAVSVLFPADTASQAAVSTPLLRDGPSDCFDSRGVVRGERLILHIDRVEALSHTAAVQHVQHECQYDEQDSVWTVSFGQATVDLLYPKEERQMTHRRTHSTNTADERSSSNPLNFYSKRILSTAYTAASSLNHTASPRPHTVTLINRAPPSPAAANRPSDATSAHSADKTRQLEALFLNGLPTYRWFEPSEGRQPDKQATAAASSSSQAASVGAAATPASSFSSSARSLAVDSSVYPTSTSDAHMFEQLSAAHSSLVVDVRLASCSVHVSKVELDLLLLVYTIYDEITTPSPPAASLPQPPPSQPPSHSLSPDQMSAGRVNTGAAPAAAAAGDRSDAAILVPSSCSSHSASASESDSEGSEMFESVVGAESVFFQAAHSNKATDADDGGSEDDNEQLASLSDLDSSDLDGDDSMNDEQLRAADLHNSQFGMHSVLMGKSQQLTHGHRRVTEAAAGHGDSSTTTTSLYSALLAAPPPAAVASSNTVSDSLLFHSFVSQPASLSSSSVLPPASSFVPATEQPYKFIKPLTHTSFCPPFSSTQSPLPSHRHRVSFRLSVLDGGVCLQEEPVPLPLFSPLSATPVPPSSLAPPQSFHLDVQHLHVFQCSKLDGKDVSYVSVRAADCTLREYVEAVEADELLTAPSIPLLFKTLNDRYSLRRGSSSTSAALWHDPVFVGQFIIAVSPSLHLRETTAALNLRALTLSYRPQSEWLGKLTDFFTLTAPPYVQTVGTPLQLNQHYTDFARQPSPQQQTDQPAPPPMTQDLLKLAFHVYDACFDYNPADIAARAVLLVDHFHLHTTVHPLSKHSDIAIEVRDAAAYLMPASVKAPPSVVASSVRQVSPPQLNRLPANSIVSYLEELGCARVSVLDYLDARIIQQDVQRLDCSQPLLHVEVTNGELEVLTCADSFAVVVEVASHITHALVKQTETREVQVTHFTQQHSSQQPNMESKYDDRQDELEVKEERKEAEQRRPQRQSGAESSQLPDILQSVDPHLFGADLGRARRHLSSQPSIVDAYCDDLNKATSISLALQAAAERELEKARRERQLNASILSMQRHEEQRNRQREAGEGHGSEGGSIDAGQGSVAQWPLDEDDAMGEQRAHWFSRSEMDEREVRDAMDQHSRTMPERSEQQPHRETDEANMRRLRDEEIEQQLEMDRERRRRRQMDSGKQVSRKHQPLQPHIIDQHVRQPADPHGFRGDRERVDGRAEGAAHSAVRRFGLGEKTSSLVAETELLLHNVSVRWKVFDGSDWLDDQHRDNTQQSEEDEADSVCQIEYGSEHLEQPHTDHENEQGMFVHASLQQQVDVSTLSAHLPAHFVHGGVALHENYVPTTVAPTITTQLSPTAAVSLPRPFVTSAVGRGVRRTDRMLELSLRGLHLLYQAFNQPDNSDGSEQRGTDSSSVRPSSSLSLAVQHVEIVDGIASSPYRLMLSSHSPSAAPNVSRLSSVHSCAVRLDALSVRSHDRPNEVREELRVEVTLHPLRVSVDQDAVELLIAFFSRPLLLHTQSTAPATESYVADESFCQLFALTHPVHLTVDYHPRRVSYSALRHGDYAQLLHLFPLRKMSLELAASTLTGLSLSAVGSHLVTQWADDIARNQLHHYLSAIQPLRSIVNVGSGMVECVLLPYSQYRKQGRMMRAVKRGVSSLAKHAAVEGLGLLLTVTHSANALLREVDAIVAPASSGRGGGTSGSRTPGSGAGSGSTSLTTRTPASLRAGLSVAYARLSASVHEAAHSLVVVPRDEWTRGGGRLGVLSVVRNLPAAALQPMIGVTDALHATIMAAQNSVDSTLVHERNEMLKRPAE